ncbi:betaine/proline/choline family ABC transporter ATP-binding protein [Chloroflexota bacterium]
MEPMIRLSDVTKHYGDTIAVDHLSLEVRDGEVCIIIGPSGCGKTTTLRMINHLIKPSSGSIFINSQNTLEIKPETLRQSIGYAIQSVGLFPHMTVAANIAVVPRLLHWPKERINTRIEELMILVNLNPSEYLNKYPSQLSGGEAQRIGVARALAADPPILLMDEPFGAVDPLTRERLQAQFARIQQELKKTIIMVTHDLDEAIRLADRIAIMESGKLVQYETPERMLARPANKFVHDFVGADRALKRLSRIRIDDYIKPALAITIGMSPNEAASVIRDYRWGWVVDGDGHLIGCIDRIELSQAVSIEHAVVSCDINEISVGHSSTLREALSRMLGQGFKHIPVIDDKNHTLLGEILMSDIEAATAEMET